MPFLKIKNSWKRLKFNIIDTKIQSLDLEQDGIVLKQQEIWYDILRDDIFFLDSKIKT